MKLELAVGLVLAGLSGHLCAQAPSGTWHYRFDEANPPRLWNFSGTYDEPFYATWNQNARGRITSDKQLTGIVSGKDSQVRVRLSAKDYWYEPYALFWGTNHLVDSKAYLLLDPDRKVLFGTNFCTEKRWWVTLLTRQLAGRKSYTEQTTIPLQETMDGSWELSFNIAPKGNWLIGGGTLTYSNGQTNGFRLSGKFYPTKQKSRIMLTGHGPDTGVSLALWVVNPEMSIESLSGTVAGQRLRLP